MILRPTLAERLDRIALVAYAMVGAILGLGACWVAIVLILE